MIQMTQALYLTSRRDKVKGSMKSRNPVTLFQRVCSKISVLFLILIPAMRTTQHQTQPGRCITGSSFSQAAPIKTKSATESSLEPNPVAEFSFRAMVPSTISVNPPTRYSPQKEVEKTGQNSSPTPHRMRQLVTRLARCFLTADGSWDSSRRLVSAPSQLAGHRAPELLSKRPHPG